MAKHRKFFGAIALVLLMLASFLAGRYLWNPTQVLVIYEPQPPEATALVNDMPEEALHMKIFIGKSAALFGDWHKEEEAARSCLAPKPGFYWRTVNRGGFMEHKGFMIVLEPLPGHRPVAQ